MTGAITGAGLSIFSALMTGCIGCVLIDCSVPDFAGFFSGAVADSDALVLSLFFVDGWSLAIWSASSRHSSNLTSHWEHLSLEDVELALAAGRSTLSLFVACGASFSALSFGSGISFEVTAVGCCCWLLRFKWCLM